MLVFTRKVMAMFFVGLQVCSLVRIKRKFNRIGNSTSRPDLLHDKVDKPFPWLKAYEIITPNVSEITLKKNNRIYTKSVRFSAFELLFHLLLYEVETHKARKLEIRVGKDIVNQKRIGEILREVKFYRGACIGILSCEVFGQVNTFEKTFEGFIKIPYIDTFHVEKIKFRDFIIFRESDTLTNFFTPATQQSTAHDIGRDRKLNNSDFLKTDSKMRKKRSTNGRNGLTCDMYIVVDHRFYQEFGSKLSQTVAEIRHIMSEVDVLFRQTDFNQDGSPDNIGIDIAGIQIHTSENDVDYPFTTKEERFRENDLNSYHSMMKFYDWSDYCMSAIFTHADTDGTLGLAFVPKPVEFGKGIEGGICEIKFYHYLWIRDHIGYHSFNVIAVTSNAFGNRVPRFVTVGTVAHELGHSFGSPHDQDGECTPGGAEGNYLMFYETTGQLRNNTLKFSLCSLQHIFPVIVKRGVCLLESAQPKCGDGLVEGGEECDCGDTLSCMTTDPCCTPSDSALYGDTKNEPCRYRYAEMKSCSPSTSPCCDMNCKPVTADEMKICEANSTCSNEALCDGHSADCPDASPLPPGTPCDNGRKYCDGSGACSVDICEYRGFPSCECTDFTPYLCLVCCLHQNGTCAPISRMGVMEGSRILKLPGSSCYNGCGICDAMGICRKKKQSYVLLDTAWETENSSSVFNTPAAQWLREYWYYVLVGVFCLMLFAFIVIAAIKKTYVIAPQAYQTGRLYQLFGECEVLKYKFRNNAIRIERLFDYKRHQIKNGTNPKTCNEVALKLSTLFPTVTISELGKYVSRSTSEDVAVRLLLLRGYPMKQMNL